MELWPWWTWLFLAVGEAVYSLRGGFAFASFCKQFNAEDAKNAEGAEEIRSLPPVSLILPCRGIDPGLADNLKAYLGLDYPNYQLLLVTGDEDDPVVPLLRQALDSAPNRKARIIYAGRAEGRSQKVHNLLHAVRHLRLHDDLIVFGDSDIRPAADWLRALVRGLERDLGSSPVLNTGFRWYLPVGNQFAAVLRSVWNAGAASLMREKDNFFAWGGAMAIRVSDFKRCRVVEAWQGAVSDDLAISRAVKQNGGAIRFIPRALSFSHEDCSLKELLDWSTRQMRILRVYLPSLWRLSWVGHLLNGVAVWGGLGVVVPWALLNGRMVPAGATLLLISLIYGLGVWKAALRLRGVLEVFPERRAEILRHRTALLFWGPLAALVSLQALVRSVLHREIEWRGIRYRMVSAKRTEVVG